MASLSLRHVYKVYPNGKKAVNDFSMEIGDREFIVFVGPSGCGKSTTLRMIAGLEEITTGEISIDGVVVNDMEPRDRDIAMVFQNYALYPHISVYENMAFGLKIRRLPHAEIHRRVIEAAEILGITEYLEKKPKEMSGGQRQRVALGRAIVREPKVFLLDEPLSNLDAKLRTQMRTEISKLHARLKTTFIYVTHDQTEAMTMGTRIVVMRGGFIQQIDTPRNLYSEPNSRFVASFIGTPQMNFYDVTLCREGDRVALSVTDAHITWRVPYEAFLKMRAEYLDGAHGVVMGIRAERIYLLKEGETRPECVTVPCTVSHVEDLGDVLLVYGDLSSEGADTVTETGTGVVFQIGAESGARLSKGDTALLAMDLRFAHFFDRESEESIRPSMPRSNVFDVFSDGKTIAFAGMRFPLPQALCRVVEGEGQMELPLDALRVTEDAKPSERARVVRIESVKEGMLTHLSSGGRIFFLPGAHGAVGEEIGLSPDFQRAFFYRDGACICEAMREKSMLYGRMHRETVRKDRKKTVAYCFEMAGIRHPIPDAILSKLLKSAGMGILKKKLRYEIPPHAVSVGAGDIPAAVLKNLDYGAGGHFTVLLIDGREVIARTDRAFEGHTVVSVDLEAITYFDDEQDVLLL